MDGAKRCGGRRGGDGAHGGQRCSRLRRRGVGARWRLGAELSGGGGRGGNEGIRRKEKGREETNEEIGRKKRGMLDN